MKHLDFKPALAAFLLFSWFAGLAAEEPKAARKPNIIFILADDLGIDCVSCYGADHFQTPNVDALAKGGLRFEHCYASPLCGPSRALLMTGRYAYHTGVINNEAGKFLEPSREIMMPRVLKPAGYVTGQCGKWHQLSLQPRDWGFDEYLRFEGSGKYWNSQTDAKAYTLNGRSVPLRDGEYLPDRMHEFCVDFITRHREQPFYLYYSMSHVHAQIMPTPDTVPGTADRFRIYQDNVAYMDKLVGKLIAALDRLGLRENTLILFAGDNGTATEWYERCTINGGKSVSGHKQTLLECGALVPCIAHWPGHVPAAQVTAGLINICDFYPTIAALAGAKLPAGVTIDGQDFAPQLLGQSTTWPRNWIFVQLDRNWYDRDRDWKLNQARELFDMRQAPFAEPLIPSTTTDETALAARRRLQAVLDELNPAAGILDLRAIAGKPADKKKKLAKKAARGEPADAPSPSGNPGNQNKEDQ
jgi:arylsulfatase A